MTMLDFTHKDKIIIQAHAYFIFYIGGMDTNVYCHTKQEGKADIIFYCDVK